MGKKISNDEFIRRSHIIHKNFYNYIDEYQSSHKKITIDCPIHGTFSQAPYSHLQGIGCPKCGFDKNAESNRKGNENFINQARRLHGDFYNYDKVKYTNNKNNVIITCPIHGDFEQLPQNHLNGHICKGCAPKKQKKLDYKFKEEANKIHNNKFNYKDTYKGAHEIIKITCPIHGDFEQTPNSHLKGRGCPNCQISNSSKLEKMWLDLLGIDKKYRNKSIIIDKKIYKLDAYIQETKTIYEFYGDFWHGNPNKYKDGDYNLKNNIKFSELYRKTIMREKYLKDNGYNIISIWEEDFIKNNKQIINQKYKYKL